MASPDIDPRFDYGPDPDHPGWYRWDIRESDRFNGFLGPIRLQATGDKGARVRIVPEKRHSNLADAVHGGVTLAFIDIALFATARTLGIDLGARAVTIELATQFTGAGRLDYPLDAECEIARETRSLVFVRGLVVQGDGNERNTVASFTGIIKKSTDAA